VLLLEPSNEGTHVRLLEEFKEVKDLLDVGIPLDEAIVPRTRPEHVDELTLFNR
jgi:hypothetical protein